MHSSSRKTHILEQIRTTRHQFEEALAQVSPERMTQPGVNDEWSVKDMLAHIAWWEQHLLRRLRTGHEDLYVAGEEVRETVARVNAEIFTASRERPLAEVRVEYDASFHEVLATIEAMPDNELASEEMDEIIGVDTFQHYPEHTAMLTAWLEANPNPGA